MSAQSYSIFETVTKSDTVANQYKALYIGGTGKVDIEQRGSGITASFAAVPAGTLLPVMTEKVLASTGATLIIGLN
jgi:hypothetical protein